MATKGRIRPSWVWLLEGDLVVNRTDRTQADLFLEGVHREGLSIFLVEQEQEELMLPVHPILSVVVVVVPSGAEVEQAQTTETKARTL